MIDWRKRLEEDAKKFKEYVESKGYVPGHTEFQREFPRTYKAIKRRKFVFPEEGIEIRSYKDFVEYCGYQLSYTPHGTWKDEEALERAAQFVDEFIERHGRIPKAREIPRGFIQSLSKGYYKKYGISTWNQFLQCYMGLEPIRVSPGSWIGEEGIERAKEFIEEFEKEHGRLPTLREMPSGFIGALRKGEYGTKSFSEFLEKIGKVPNQKPHRYWQSEKAIEKARETVKKFIEERGRIPTRKELVSVYQGLKGAGEDPFILFHRVLLEEFLPEVFTLEDFGKYIKEGGRGGDSPKSRINKLIKAGLVYELGNGFYTSNQEIADLLSEGKRERRERAKGIYRPANKIFEAGSDTKVEIAKSKSRRKPKRIKTETGTEGATKKLGKADELRLKILKYSKARPSELTEDEFKEYSEIYSKYIAPKHKHLLKELLREIESENGLKVLDLGCGTASPVYQALVELGKSFEYVGVDESKEAIERNEKSENAKFLQARIPYEIDVGKIGKNYDLIVASYFFDALNPSEIALTLLKAHEMLSGNGKFLILLPKESKDIASFILKTFKRMGYRVKNLEDYKYRAKFSSGDSKAYETVYIIEVDKSANYEILAELKENLENAALLERKEFEKLKNKDLKDAIKYYRLVKEGEVPFVIIDFDRINKGEEILNKMEKGLEEIEQKIEEIELEYKALEEELRKREEEKKFWESKEGFEEGMRRARELKEKLGRPPCFMELEKIGLREFLKNAYWGKYREFGVRDDHHILDLLGWKEFYGKKGKKRRKKLKIE